MQDEGDFHMIQRRENGDFSRPAVTWGSLS